MISPTKRGAIVEHKATILFLDAGFEVFTNAAPDGPADIIVWDRQNFYAIDTKKVTKSLRKDGSVYYNWCNPKNTKPSDTPVYYLGNAGDEWVWLTEPPAALEDVF